MDKGGGYKSVDCLLLSKECHQGFVLYMTGFVLNTRGQGSINFLAASGHRFSKNFASHAIFQRRFIETFWDKKCVFVCGHIHFFLMWPILIKLYISSILASQNNLGLRRPSMRQRTLCRPARGGNLVNNRSSNI